MNNMESVWQVLDEGPASDAEVEERIARDHRKIAEHIASLGLPEHEAKDVLFKEAARATEFHLRESIGWYSYYLGHYHDVYECAQRAEDRAEWAEGFVKDAEYRVKQAEQRADLAEKLLKRTDELLDCAQARAERAELAQRVGGRRNGIASLFLAITGIAVGVSASTVILHAMPMQ